VHTQREAWKKSLLVLKKEGAGEGLVDAHKLLANTCGCLSQERIDRLIELGMGTNQHGLANVLKDVHATSWKQHFQLLVECQRQHGHLNVTATHDKQLDKWVQRQRKSFQTKCHVEATGRK
jgi:Helicase associated domain